MKFKGIDGSFMVYDEESKSIFITFTDEDADDAMTLEQITSLEFTDAMYIRGLKFSGVYALDLYRIYTTDLQPEFVNKFYKYRSDVRRANELSALSKEMVGKACSGVPIDFKELLHIQDEHRCLQKQIEVEMTEYYKYVYTVHRH